MRRINPGRGLTELGRTRLFPSILGVDFSGAKMAGRTIWLARLHPRPGEPALLAELDRLESLCGTAERGPALEWLVGRVRETGPALWAIDCPFGLPVELFPTWPEQFRFLRTFDGDAYAAGVECLRRARALNGPQHIRRLTDGEAKTPFDCYHYRIVYQMYFGMRDVVGRLRRDPSVAVLPFQYRKLRRADRVVVEACPSSTLKAMGLPHQNYKQPAGGPLTRRRLKTRRTILQGLTEEVEVPATLRRRMMRDGGGDALDAVIAAVGGWRGWQTADHAAIARHPRYRHEGRIYAG